MSENLKRVNILNDNVAVLKVLDLPEGIQVDEASASKICNEGVVVGVGPDAQIVQLGDRVIFRPNKYMTIQPASGGYAGREVVIVRKMDLVIKLEKSNKFEIVDE